MFLFKKMMTAQAIAELPTERRVEVEKVWDILNQIELYWTWYPLYTFGVLALGLLVWLDPGGGNVPSLGLTPWATGIVWATIAYLVIVPLTKAILLSRTKRLLRNLKMEFETVEGKRAGKLLDELDGGALWVVKCAAQRKVLHWIW